VARSAAAFHLRDAVMLALRFDEQFAFARVVPARLLHVNVLPRLHRKQGGWGVPVVGRRDHQCVHVLVLERLPKVAQPLGDLPWTWATAETPFASTTASTSHTDATSA